jgi:hypothetical protein
MPHQCLKCGRVFEEGSSELLRGCPDCGGNRFFYTKQPLNEKERDVISQEFTKDITSKIMDSLAEKNKDIHGKSGKWVAIKPKEIRKIIEEKINETNSKKVSKEEIKEEPIEPIEDEYHHSVIDKITSNTNEPHTPETIDIEKPGRYNIDLKGLLENEPIIIQKDGTYIIHLPSVFKMIDQEF